MADILAGKIRHAPYETKLLMETVKSAEGRSDVDRTMLAEIEDQPAPGDVDLQAPGAAGSSFGIPEADDPDPFGVLALENAGLEIREAGSHSRPSSTQFEFNPSPSSPIYGKSLYRRSMDTLATRSNRESYMSTRSSRTRTSTDRATQTAEMGTQTADFSSPSTSPSLSAQEKVIQEEDERQIAATPEEVDYTKIDLSPIRHLTESHNDDLDNTTSSGSPRTLAHSSDTDNRLVSRDTSIATDDEYDEEEEEEEAVIFEAASAQATVITPQVIKARGGVVNIPKRPPPPALPPRSAARVSRTSIKMVDQASGQTPVTPTKDGFEDVETHGADRRSVEAEKPIVMEDKEILPPPRFTLSNGVELDLGLQHAERSTPSVTVTAGTPEKASREMRKDDEDTFHSVPTTPMEHAAEIRAN